MQRESIKSLKIDKMKALICTLKSYEAVEIYLIISIQTWRFSQYVFFLCVCVFL